MVTINQLRNRLKSANISEISQSSIEETKDGIIKRQKDQLLHGINVKGQKIGRYRNNKYARVKNEMNPLPGLYTPDLKLTGAFYRGINVEVTPDVFKTDSTDGKTRDLEEKYGEEIMGLDPDNKSDYVNQTLRPVFMKKFKEKTGL